jgi:hypothetical protein
MAILFVGIDLAKNVLALHGGDEQCKHTGYARGSSSSASPPFSNGPARTALLSSTTDLTDSAGRERQPALAWPGRPGRSRIRGTGRAPTRLAG